MFQRLRHLNEDRLLEMASDQHGAYRQALDFGTRDGEGGMAAQSNGQVFCCMLSAASTYTSRGASGAGISVAGNGMVGIASTSYCVSTLSSRGQRKRAARALNLARKSSRLAPAPVGYDQAALLVERLGSRESAICRLQMTGNAKQHSKAIPQNPAGPKRENSQPESMVVRAVAPPIPTVP